MMGIYLRNYRNLKHEGGIIHTSLNIEHLSACLSRLKPYNSPLTTAASNPEHAASPANIFLLLYPVFFFLFPVIDHFYVPASLEPRQLTTNH